MNLAHLLQRMARQHPNRAALFQGTQAVATHGAWAQRSAHLAQQFQTAGLKPGDRVALFMHNHPRYLEVMFGAWWAGLVVVPINAKLHVREAQWIVDNAQASWAFVTRDVTTDTGEQLQGLQRVIDVDSQEAHALWAMPTQANAEATAPSKAITQRQSDDLAWLFYTSGTTGRPKGVMITHRNLMTMGFAYFTDVDAITDQDAIVYAAPMSHGAGLYAIPHLMVGARHVVTVSGGFDAAELFNLGQAVGPLSLFAAPTIVKRLVDHAEQCRLTQTDCALAFKTIVYGGAPMYAADIQRALRIMGPRFVQIYGQGESPMVGTALSRFHLSDTAHPEHAQRLASIGVAQTPVQIRITDEHGHDLALGEVGEVLILSLIHI